MNFTFYQVSDGKVLFTSDLQSEENAKNIVNVTEGSAYIAGEYSSDFYTVINGQAVRKDEAEIQQNASEQAWRRFRDIRDSVLSACDWTQVPDAPVDQAAWAAYRQQLRDLPENTVDPANPIWPTPPT